MSSGRKSGAGSCRSRGSDCTASGNEPSSSGSSVGRAHALLRREPLGGVVVSAMRQRSGAEAAIGQGQQEQEKQRINRTGTGPAHPPNIRAARSAARRSPEPRAANGPVRIKNRPVRAIIRHRRFAPPRFEAATTPSTTSLMIYATPRTRYYLALSLLLLLGVLLRFSAHAQAAPPAAAGSSAVSLRNHDLFAAPAAGRYARL